MSKKDVFGDSFDKNEGNSFESLFEQSLSGVGRKLSVGDIFTGEILSIGKEEAFIATATPQDAMILRSDLLDADKNLKYKVGDKIEVTVVKTKGGEIRVTKAGSKKANADLDSLEDAYDMEMAVEGKVSEVCNGGFRVLIQNKTAFCPVSQMDYKVGDHQSYVGQKFEFLITQFDPKGRNLVVSRRRLLDLQKVENEGEFLNKVKPGDIVSGIVSRMEKFGAFISLGGGVDGLCHISEIGWSRLQDPSEVLSLGQSVKVKVLEQVELEGRLKISLSIKQAGDEGDPWMMVTQKFPVGSQHDGTVEKKEQYGLFVNIAPGITGLLPRSKWRDHIDAAAFETKKKGDKIKIQVDEILFEQKKMSLGVAGSAEDQSWREHTPGKSGFSTNNNFGSLANLIKKG